jgi:hypothetical protein
VPTGADITLMPSASASPEQARDARARAWSYVFECFNSNTKKKVASASDLDDGTIVKEDSANEHRST